MHSSWYVGTGYSNFRSLRGRGSKEPPLDSCDGRRRSTSPNLPVRIQGRALLLRTYVRRKEDQWHTTTTRADKKNVAYLVASELHPKEGLCLRVIELVVPPEVAGNRAEATRGQPSWIVSQKKNDERNNQTGDYISYSRRTNSSRLKMGEES